MFPNRCIKHCLLNSAAEAQIILENAPHGAINVLTQSEDIHGHCLRSRTQQFEFIRQNTASGRIKLKNIKERHRIWEVFVPCPKILQSMLGDNLFSCELMSTAHVDSSRFLL